jgi:hypothetical protein
MAGSVLFVDLGLDASNDDILDQMRILKRAREERCYKAIVCLVRGFDDDPRELFDIPEVRAFCRRIVNLGFISYLDFTTFFDPEMPEEAKKAWGAAEVWLCSEGRLKLKNTLMKKLLDELEQVVRESNGRADKAVGPMRC